MKGTSKRYFQGKSMFGCDVPYVVYIITNLIDGKFYVGSSINYKNRWSHHLNLLRNNRHHNNHLQRAYNKNGEENFMFTVLVSLFSKEKIRELEQYYLNLYFDLYETKLYNHSRIVEGGLCAPNISGELNPKAKLSRENVEDICAEFNLLNNNYGARYKILSEKYLVSPLTISRIIRKKSWKNDRCNNIR